jgi:adenylate cyclase
MERKLAAIFSADVKGYSRLMGDDEIATVRTLTAYREVMTALIHTHHGRVVDSPGDNMLAEFASVVDAVHCATEIQQHLAVRNAALPTTRQMAFRIGINVGDVLTEDGRLYGDGVNIAARVEGLAEAGGICISEAAYTQVKNKLALGYEDIGEQQVKNIAEPVRVYRIQWEETESSKFKVQGSKAKERRAGFARRRGAMVAVAGLLLITGTLVAVRYLSRPPLSPQSSVLSPQPSPLSPQPSAFPTQSSVLGTQHSGSVTAAG